MRIYELAKKYGVESKALVVLLQKAGFDVKSHMSVVSDDAHAHVEKHFSKQKPEKAKNTVLTKTTQKQKESNKSVASIRSRQEEPSVSSSSERPAGSRPAARPTSSRSVHRGQAKPVVRRKSARQVQREKQFARRQPVIKEPVTHVEIEGNLRLFEAADLFGKMSSELILPLLKNGMVCNRNHILTPDVIKPLGQVFGITVDIKVPVVAEEGHSAKKHIDMKGQFRWPVVVVMGHVDHGKTTLLDYIRKAKVAASEKGGITQHIHAWEAESSHGKIVFLDTPGHEAFSYLRKRGASVTDIAVLVVAADDGIKPQTVEAIKHAKEAGVPIIIAINKIDKVHSQAPIETVKRQLSDHDLLPEEWGGQTVVVPISAITGKGVDELLEMIVLQSQLMELKAEAEKPARAFVLESNQQKGYGSVSTVICSEGTLRQGDYFICGKSTGKVRILLDSHGKKIKEAGPSKPVMVVGFDSFPDAGDWLAVVSQKEYARAKSGKDLVVSPAQMMTQTSSEGSHAKSISLIVKTDTRGSKEAISDSIEKLVKAHKDIKCPINVISSTIGDITEGDVELAENTGAILLGLHVKAEKNAQKLAQSKKVGLQTFNIIYKMMDFLQEMLESKREIIKEWVKTGEAEVRKVFAMKNSVIAGCYMKEGVLARGNKVLCMRKGEKIGEGRIGSLQRDRKTVKEVHAGYECGFVVDGFNDWKIGDTAECYVEKAVK